MGCTPSKGEEKILVKPSGKNPARPKKSIDSIKIEEVEASNSLSEEITKEQESLKEITKNQESTEDIAKELESTVDLDHESTNQVNFKLFICIILPLTLFCANLQFEW